MRVGDRVRIAADFPRTGPYCGYARVTSVRGLIGVRYWHGGRYWRGYVVREEAKERADQ